MKCFFVLLVFVGLGLAVMLFGSAVSFDLFNTGVPGSGVLKTESRELEPFDSIEFAGAAKIKVTCGSPTSLTLTADDNLLEFLATQVAGTTLKISTTKSISPTQKPTFEISVEKLTELNLMGSGDADIVNLAGEQASFAISGSGEIQADGAVDQLDMTILGSGDADLAGVTATQASIEINGSGDITVNASEKLDIRIAGSGNVDYLGSPEIRKSIAGSGNVRQVEKE